MGSSSPAPDDTSSALVRIAEFISQRVRARAGSRWLQARRRTSLAWTVEHPSLAVFGERHILGVSELAVRGLCAIDSGLKVELLPEVPSAQHVLSLQARGQRCVSLLSDPILVPFPHRDAVDFALHDLCHLAKFADPEHYAEQVGFFGAVHDALAHPRWQARAQSLDPEWRRESMHVLADMNGSSVFLFAVLKMKLKMAARRSVAVRSRAEAPASGALDPQEARAFEALLRDLLDAFHFDADVREAAWTVSTRRDSLDAAAKLAEHFRSQGERALRYG
jgi:hypothetical protein